MKLLLIMVALWSLAASVQVRTAANGGMSEEESGLSSECSKCIESLEGSALKTCDDYCPPEAGPGANIFACTLCSMIVIVPFCYEECLGLPPVDFTV